VERAGEAALARPAPLDDADAAVAARSSSVRTTITDWSRIWYSTKSLGRGISSSRQAICHTLGHSSSASSPKKSGSK
jgi:hypothetical protein